MIPPEIKLLLMIAELHRRNFPISADRNKITRLIREVEGKYPINPPVETLCSGCGQISSGCVCERDRKPIKHFVDSEFQGLKPLAIKGRAYVCVCGLGYGDKEALDIHRLDCPRIYRREEG